MGDASAAGLVLLPTPLPLAASVAAVGDAALLLATVVLLAAFRRIAAFFGNRDVVHRVASVQGFLVIALVVVGASRGG